MKLIRYIFREISPPFWMGLLLYSALFLFGYFFVGSKWLGGVPLIKILEWLMYKVPDTLVKVFPMAIVLMVVVAMGRLMNERELVAMSAGGVSLRRIAFPALLVALLTSLGALALQEYVTPKSELESRRFWYEELPKNPAGLSRLAGSSVPLGSGLELYFQGYNQVTQDLLNVRVANWKGTTGTLVFADSAQYRDNNLFLKNPLTTTFNFDQFAALEGAKDYKSVMKVLQKAIPIYNPPADKESTFKIETGTSRAQAIAKYADGFAAETRSLSELWGVLRDPSKGQKEHNDARISFNSQLALPFANLVLALVSLPFAMRFGRGTGVALGMSVVIVLVYYLLFALGQALAATGSIPPEICIWLPNVVFGFLGWRMINH